MSNFVSVAVFADNIEAQLAQATLAAAEIDSFIQADDASGMLEFLDFSKGVKLLVDEKNFEEAKTILSEEASPNQEE